MSIKVFTVTNRKDLKEFINLPYRLHSKEVGWVAPLLIEVKRVLNKKKNPFFDHAILQQFIARNDGVTVGRIAAIVDQNYIEARNEAIGLFGYFDCINDLDVAKALFNTASQWLREKQMVKMIGPINPSLNDEIGVQLDSFKIPPAVRMPWNPSYYPKFYNSAIFHKVTDLLAWNLTKNTASEQMIKTSQVTLNRSSITFRNLEMKNFYRDIEVFQDIYNQTCSDSWGFVTWTADEFTSVAKSLKPVIDPKLVLIAEHNGNPVGFSIAIPDTNISLKRMNGKLLPFGFIKRSWYSRKIKRFRIMILRVINEYRNRGIETAMYQETWRVGTEVGYESCEISGILEGNEPMNRAASMMGAEIYKTYRVYERKLQHAAI